MLSGLLPLSLPAQIFLPSLAISLVPTVIGTALPGLGEPLGTSSEDQKEEDQEQGIRNLPSTD